MKKSIVVILYVSILLVGCATPLEYQCDAGKPETTPASRFEINRTDGTLFDTKTKLIWKVCAEGQSYAGGHCAGGATGFAWDKATQTFGDKGDSWRLPNVDELNSLIEVRCRTPAINMAIFQNAPSSSFWTGFSDNAYPSDAWVVNFNDGSSYANSKSNNYYVRLVRGSQWFDASREEKLKQAELLEKQKREAEQAAKQAAAQAEKDAYVTCNDRTSCDKTFSLAQIYINSMASQKIQVATDTIIETYNPTEYGNIGMGAVKIPGKGSSAIVRVSVTCKVSDSGHFAKYCESKKLDIYNGFRPFVSKMLGD